MQGDSSQDNLPHLAIDREPDLAHPRRPPQPFGSSSSRSDRGHHARDAKQLTSTAQSAVAAARARSGVDPSRLVVLELATVERTARDELERRLNATVVDERIQSRETVNYLVEAEGFDESTMPTGSRLRRAQKADIDAAHKVAPAEVVRAGGRRLAAVPAVRAREAWRGRSPTRPKRRSHLDARRPVAVRGCGVRVLDLFGGAGGVEEASARAGGAS